jgi:hypothetical protein
LPHTPASIAAPYLYDVSDEPPPAPFEGTVIDDLSDEFSLQGPQTYWHETDFGYNGHFWWTKNTASGVENVGRWSLSNFDAGTYDIYVYIPGANSTTHQARYSIHHAGEVDIVTVDQSNHRETWYKLGAFELKGFGKEYVELTDETGEPDLSFEVAFDAIGVLQQEPGFEEKIVDALWTKIQPWLDKLGEEIKSRFGEWLEEQKAKLLRSLADSLKSWIDQQCANVGAALVLPLFAFILWRKKRNNI